MKERWVVWAMQWEESEAGWGCRPDGFTLHVDEANAKKYISDQRAAQIADHKKTGRVPHEYTRADGDPFEVHVDQQTYDKVHAAENGYIWGRPSGTVHEGRDGVISVPEYKSGWRPNGR